MRTLLSIVCLALGSALLAGCGSGQDAAQPPMGSISVDDKPDGGGMPTKPGKTAPAEK